MNPLKAQNLPKGQVLIVDLNNFATFPTLAIGILVASLRDAGYDVNLLCPLAYDVPAATREKREKYIDHLARKIHLSTWKPFYVARDTARQVRQWWINRPHSRVIYETEKALNDQPAAILLSAYLQHYPTVFELGKIAESKGIPLILGGPVFNMGSTVDAWRSIPGLSAIVGAEVDLSLSEIVEQAIYGRDLLKYKGITLPNGEKSAPAEPLQDLDKVPVPDYTDFPWDRYKYRVIPLMTGRGCQWAKCTFCSDVWSVNGRTFRTRSVGSVLHEMREQARRHQTNNFLFLDLKLNSNPAMFRGLTENIQRYIPGAQWVGTVHVDRRKDNGLARRDLKNAVLSGMRRISFGLESGSQRMLDLMDKGCTVEANEEFIRNAYEAGLSVRATMFSGYLGELAKDLELTAEFLERNSKYLDRIRFNDFSIHEGAPVYNFLRNSPSQFPKISVTKWDDKHARVKFYNLETESKSYRRAKSRVLKAVHEINKKQIRASAYAFDGLM